jgi:hypothetical protein
MVTEPVQPGLDIRAGSSRMAQGNVTSIFKGGSMDATQCNSYRPITVLPVMTNSLQQSSQTTEQNVHTARSPVSVQERGSTLDPLLAFTALEKQRQRDGLRTHVLPRHAKAYDKVWHAACSGAQEWWHHRQTVAHHP